MEKRTLGNKGLVTSEIGFGCMGLNHHRGAAKDKKGMIAVIHSAIDSGITMFDTAEVYGPYTNEEIVGEAIQGHRDKIQVATKCGFKINEKNYVPNSSPELIRSSIEGSLDRLKTDYIDLYYVHRVDPNVDIEEVAYVMQNFKKEGKIRHWGISEANAETIRRAHRIEPLTAIQSEYSMWWRTLEDEIIPTIEELGIGLVAYSPLGRGFLTGKIDKNMSFGENDNRADLPRFTKEAMDANQTVVEYIEQLAKEKQATSAQIALAWVLSQKPWIVPIPGTTRTERIIENNYSAKIIFSEAEKFKINGELSKIVISGDRY